jgi:hypothetical protein
MTVAGSGWNLLAVFFGDMRQVGWPGQFNLDFMQMLTLSAIWVAWRHRFSPAGLVFAGLAFFGGSLFLSAYLLVISLGRRSGSGGRRSGGIRCGGARGGVCEILVGPSRVAALGD